MNEKADVDFEMIHSGVPNLDVVLGGGIPTGSFNLIAGGPGTGKTILSQQIMFHNATPERLALHFTVLGEPVAKLLRYQRRLSFFDPSKVNTSIRFIDIGDVVRKEGLQRGLEMIVSRVERYAPSIVVIDSVRAVRELAGGEGDLGLRSFTYDLAQVAVVWNATSFMVGEYEAPELRAGPEFTMADGIIWMGMDTVANSVVRKLHVVKSRGMNIVQGLHSFRIDQDGIYVYPRLAVTRPARPAQVTERVSFGVPGLDRMMEGGVPRGEVCLIAGASGTGKSILAQHFLAEGLRGGEPAVAVVFEETPAEYITGAESFGWEFGRWEREGKLSLVYRGPMDLTTDQITDDVRHAVDRTGARRVVLDSISGFELARAPADRSNFREVLYRLTASLTAEGITVLMTTEIPEVFGELRFSTYDISFVADNIILLRYIEIESELRRVLAVVKMRRSWHDKELRQYQITPAGAVVGAPYREYAGLLSGVPSLVAIMGPQPFAPGLEPRESALVHALFGLGRATADELVAETGFASEEVEGMLARLVGTGYVVRETAEGKPSYHVSMVSWSPGIKRPPRKREATGGGEASVEG